MCKFSKSSLEKLQSCDLRIQLILAEVIKQYDCTILEGHRSTERQKELVAQNKSKTMNSKHLLSPSKAIDVSPYPIPENFGNISWELVPEEHRETLERQFKERAKFYHFNGYVKAIANALGYRVRIGNDWDGDNDFNDQKFDDLVHTELSEDS